MQEHPLEEQEQEEQAKKPRGIPDPVPDLVGSM